MLDLMEMEYALFILYPLAIIRPWLILPALALHGALIAQTAVLHGRIPLIGLHDTLGFLAFSIGIIYLMFGWRRKRDLFSFITVPLILLLVVGSVASPSMSGPLPPVLNTIWFELHVILSFVSY